MYFESNPKFRLRLVGSVEVWANQHSFQVIPAVVFLLEDPGSQSTYSAYQNRS